MSLLAFEQSPGTLRGWMLYHADPAWDLEPPDPGANVLGPTCDNGEGRGCWLGFSAGKPLWAALLRRGDAPYNDCLPPSESLVPGALNEAGEAETVLDRVRTAAEADFYNPFNLVLGDPQAGDLLFLQQSFQAQSRSLKPGFHLLEDESVPGDIPGGLPDFLREDVPPWEELVEGFQAGRINRLETLPDPPMREVRALTLFQWEAGTLRVEHGSGAANPAEMEWESLTRSVPP